MKVIIIGGVAGGATTAARLRRVNKDAEILVFEKGPYISYANCGLTYHISGVIENRENLLLTTPRDMKLRFNIDVKVENEVIQILPNEKKVKIKDLKSNEIYEENRKDGRFVIGSYGSCSAGGRSGLCMDTV